MPAATPTTPTTPTTTITPTTSSGPSASRGITTAMATPQKGLMRSKAAACGAPMGPNDREAKAHDDGDEALGLSHAKGPPGLDDPNIALTAHWQRAVCRHA